MRFSRFFKKPGAKVNSTVPGHGGSTDSDATSKPSRPHSSGSGRSGSENSSESGHSKVHTSPSSGHSSRGHSASASGGSSSGHGSSSRGGYSGSQSRSSGSRFGGSRGGFGGGSRGGSRGGSSYGGRSSYGGHGRARTPSRRVSGTTIPLHKFINKAEYKFDEKPYEPTHNFADFEIVDSVKKNIADKGYERPTPIQDQAIPHILQGKDVVGLANTGTGKTAAFLIPLINKIVAGRPTAHEKVLIMVPTRELATQIYDEFVGFAKGLHIYSAVCVGGVGVGSQISQLRRRPNVVIATPGRLKDLVKRKLLKLENCANVVLDEADRMLDMGFVDDIRFILSMLPKERLTLFFSATMPPEIKNLIKEFLHDPVHVSVKMRDTSANVDQDVVRVKDRKRKLEVLEEVLRSDGMNKVLIFGRTKFGVEKLAHAIHEMGFKVGSIHGNKTQAHRQKSLNLFKTGEINILVATDVAARGLDIPQVSHVINYEVPATYDDYVHRIGRTGRADQHGKALTFVDA